MKNEIDSNFYKEVQKPFRANFEDNKFQHQLLFTKLSKTINQINLSKRGFSFSFDALVAILIIGVALVFAASNSTNTFDFSSQKIVQKQIAEDILDLGVDLNKLQSLNNGTIDGFILANIPPNYDYQLQIDSYKLLTKFDLSSTQTFGNLTADLNSNGYVESKKIFIIYGGNDANTFCSAKLRMWVR